ncbi:M4 family metallopeptidase [Kitasatospora sp. NPDC058063]|uniref:M4 family metallopeptidase n=1 Tax=unclassified Kitasatospora TaxID=2633591 RepID=UPI0036DAA9FA
MDTNETPAPHREIYDAKNQQSLPGTLVRSEGEAESADDTVNAVYDALGTVVDFFHTVYGRDSLDGKGGPLRATVHHDKESWNPFWDGQRLVLGDGDGKVFRPQPRGLLDVITGTLTPLVLNPELLYFHQSGALTVSVGDVFGSLVKQHSLGQSADQADWLIGAGVFAPGIKAKGVRSLAAPGTAYDDGTIGKDPQKSHMDDYVDMPLHRDNGGIHINSGIPNRAFHLAATAIGGNAWEKAGRIWYDAVTGGKLSEKATFADFATLTATVAEELYGTGAELDAVNEAWKSVGVLS